VAIVADNKEIFVTTTTAKGKYDPGNLQGVAENRGKG
jgi:hypothetical protein